MKAANVNLTLAKYKNSKYFAHILSLGPHNNSRKYYHHTYFTDEETEDGKKEE